MCITKSLDMQRSHEAREAESKAKEAFIFSPVAEIVETF